MKLGQAAQVAFILVASLAVYGFVHAALRDHRRQSCVALCELRPSYADHNRTVPDFELPDWHSKPVRLSSLLEKDGNGVVLHFWSKACAPCLEELPTVADFATTLALRDVPFVSVCADDGPEAVRDELLKRLKVSTPPFMVLFDPDLDVILDKFGTSLYPETWLVDPDGIIRARIDGVRDWRAGYAMDVVDMIGKPSGCPMQFAAGRPVGPFAALCEQAPF